MGAILVTGGYGLVGSQFVGSDYIKYSSKEFDLRDTNRVNSMFTILEQDPNQLDGVIHTAGKVGGLGGNMNHKGEFFYDNIMMNTNIIEACRKFGVQNFVGFLSTCVFPDDIEYPLSEEKIHLGPPHFSNDAYSYAKRMMDVQIRAYREQYSLNYKSVIPTNIYGPNDNFDIVNGHVLPSLIHKCFVAREYGGEFEVWGSGKPLREFIFAKDVAKLTEWVLKEYDENEPIILSTSEEIAIKDIVDLIVQEMNYKGEVKWLSDKPDGQFRKPSNNNKIKSYLPDFKFTPIEEGIKETVQWFEDNHPNIRK
jgi:GDP-L-fucose synthase